MRRDHDGDPVRRLRTEVARVLEARVPPAAPIIVALSGGRDSVALLDALLAVATFRGHALTAVHVHHGLSANADAWARFCEELCAARGVTFALWMAGVVRAPQQSLEATARIARYGALAATAAARGIVHVALAHHRGDQAETLLLQLLRGAGPRGLAAMPVTARDDAGVTWLRPLLELPRAAIDAYVEAAQLRFVDDESNASHTHRRNAVRHRVMPALAGVFPDPERTLARAAGLQAEAARLADDLAALDAGAAGPDPAIDRDRLAALPSHRAANMLRWFLRQHGLPAPSAARLEAMLAQLRTTRADAEVRIAHAGRGIGIHRGRIVVHALPPPAFDVPWSGAARITLPHGHLDFTRIVGAGIDATRLAGAPVRVRSRAGGERFCPGAGRPRRALKSLLQEAAVPPWLREATPLVFCGDELVWVPQLGIAPAFAAAPAGAGVAIAWHPVSDRLRHPGSR
jgi:tRNA(Ile)-lysidine synthase